MAAETASESIDYMQEIARIVNRMPLREVVQVYEYAVALQTQSSAHTVAAEEDDDDWLNVSEEELLAEDKLWDEFFARNAEMFDALAEAAKLEIELGLTQPMFDDSGEFIADELPHNT
ncbi:MAG: hypothetical protein WBO46_24755 [Caldilineaceae bacterium]